MKSTGIRQTFYSLQEQQAVGLLVLKPSYEFVQEVAT